MNNLSVVKQNDLIEASYSLSVQAQKLVIACLGKIDSRAEIPRSVKISGAEFGELMGINQKNAHRELYKAANVLFDAVIVIKDGDTETKLRWVQKQVTVLKRESSVELVWSDDVRKYISQLKSRFTSYKLSSIASLQRAHSIRLYELLMRFNQTKERVISVTKLKEALGIPDNYPDFKAFHRSVLKPSVKELNTSSDLDISYETIPNKSGKIVMLEFTFKQKKQMSLPI